MENERVHEQEQVLVAFAHRESTGERIEFELPAVIGCGPNATFKLFGNPDIARLHCSIFQASGRQMIKDLTCTPNAVFVNNKGLPSRGSRFIKPGAVFSIGNEDFEFGGLLTDEEVARYLQEKAARLEEELSEDNEAIAEG